MDKIRSGVAKVTDEAGDLAQTTKIRMEISGLQRRREELLQAMGDRVFALHAGGTPLEMFDTSCRAVADLDDQIRQKEAEIDRIQNEDATVSDV